MSETIYLGNGKQSKHPKIVNATISFDKLKEEYWSEYEGKKYLKISIIQRDEPDNYGKTHSIQLNNWTPDLTNSLEPQKTDLPF
jgi:hypothetical protein